MRVSGEAMNRFSMDENLEIDIDEVGGDEFVDWEARARPVDYAL